MDDHIGHTIAAEYALWHRLVDYNVLGTINLTVFVTQSEGLNPSFNFITPLTSLGGPIEHVIESSNGIKAVSNATTNTNNYTLAVGFQLNGVQDHNFVLNYVIDLHRLYDDKKLLSQCRTSDLRDAGGLHYGLQGDLALRDTIETSLSTWDAATYSPVTVGSGGKSGQQTPSVSQTAGTTAGSSKIDFSIAWGLNGGPGWNLLNFKGPSGGTGPGGQLANYSRQKMDTLIATFSPTCKADKDESFDDSTRFLAPYLRAVPPPKGQVPAKYASFEIDAFRRRGAPNTKAPPMTTRQLEVTNDRAKKFALADALYMIPIAIPVDDTGLDFNSTSTVQGTFAINKAAPRITDRSLPLANSNVIWTGFAYRKANTYSLRGSITDIQSGSFLGYIYVDIAPDRSGILGAHVRISRNAVAGMLGETTAGPATYWDSLPFCSNSGPFLSNGLNILQQLPGADSSTLQQQPQRNSIN
jgi:hypothetical protein